MAWLGGLEFGVCELPSLAGKSGVRKTDNISIETVERRYPRLTHPTHEKSVKNRLKNNIDRGYVRVVRHIWGLFFQLFSCVGSGSLYFFFFFSFVV